MSGDILSLNNIEVIYDNVALAIKGVSVNVPQGGMVALLGANGAGKTTTLRTVSGLIRPQGEVRFAGERIDRLAAEDIARRGIAHVVPRKLQRGGF